MKNKPDSRRYLRRPVQTQVEVGDGLVGGELFFDVANLSQGGVFLGSDLLLEIGETYWFSFILPGTTVAIRVLGKVAWVNKEPEQERPGSQPGMGIEFLNLSIAEAEAIKSCLEAP